MLVVAVICALTMCVSVCWCACVSVCVFVFVSFCVCVYCAFAPRLWQIPELQFSTDHQAVVWCNQLVRMLTDATVALADRCDNHTGTTAVGHGRVPRARRPTAATHRAGGVAVACNASQRAALFRRTLLKGAAPVAPDAAYSLEGLRAIPAVVATRSMRFAPLVMSCACVVALCVLARLVTPVALGGGIGVFYTPPSKQVRRWLVCAFPAVGGVAHNRDCCPSVHRVCVCVFVCVFVRFMCRTRRFHCCCSCCHRRSTSPFCWRPSTRLPCTSRK